MLLNILRGIFILIIVAFLFVSLSSETVSRAGDPTSFWTLIWAGLVITIIVFALEFFTPKKSLSALSGVFFGLLVGMLISYLIGPVIDMAIDSFRINISDEAIKAIKGMLAICVCFLTISVVIRTKDDVRFVIPYVEFSKQTKGLRPLILDTSAIIDGRIADLYQSKIFDAPLIVPRFVLNELQLIADSADKLKRNRGRRGLDILKDIQQNPAIDIKIDDARIVEVEEVKGVDQKLVMFAKNCDGRLTTTDYNLSKVAQVRGVDILNMNDLANSLKTIALPGENLQIKIIKTGEEADQGIGYLDDGTMVVVESARDKIGRDIELSITSSLQTSAGKMIFGKFEGFAKKPNNNKKQQIPGKFPATVPKANNK